MPSSSSRVSCLLITLARSSEDFSGTGKPSELGGGAGPGGRRRGQLDCRPAAAAFPQRLDTDLQHLERIRQLVQGPAQLLDRAGGQVPPGFNEELRLVGNQYWRFPIATPPWSLIAGRWCRVTVSTERIGGGVDDLVRVLSVAVAPVIRMYYCTSAGSRMG